MTEQDLQLTEQLINRARSKIHSNFEFIRSWQELIAVKNYMNAVYKVAKQFEMIGNKTFNNYITTLKAAKPDVNILLTAKQCISFAEYYNKEVAIAKDMSREYYAYILSGHILDTILGVYRKEEDLIDFRELNLWGFY